MTENEDTRPAPVFHRGQLVRQRSLPEFDGPIVAVEWDTYWLRNHGQPGWLYRTPWGWAYPAHELELVPEEEQSPLIDQLAVSVSEAMVEADIDGWGDEGAGYNWRVAARALLQNYDITPKHTVD